jgi:hypothetical protein
MTPLLALLVLSTHLIFDKDVCGKKTEILWTVDDQNAQIDICSVVEGKKTHILCDKEYRFHRYLSESNQNETFSVIKQGNTLVAQKNQNGIIKEQKYELGEKLWIQDFSFGLRQFFVSNQDQIKFEIINPKDLVMRTMVAIKEEIDYKTFHNIEYRARRVKVTLDGFYKKFWKAELWFDTKTHNLLYYKANEGPSTPYTTLTLKELKI